MSRRPRRWMAAGSLAVGLLWAAVPASAVPSGGAGTDTPGTSSSVSPSRVAVGGTLHFTVRGFPAGQTVYLKIDDGAGSSGGTVQGAGVVAAQKIAANGTASGSFELPSFVGTGPHWVRYLASKPVLQNGQQVGVLGYTNRGGSDFTVVGSAAGAGTSAGQVSGGAAPSTGAPSGSRSPSTIASNTGSPAASGPAASGTPTGAQPLSAETPTNAAAVVTAGGTLTAEAPAPAEAPASEAPAPVASSSSTSPVPATAAAATDTDGVGFPLRGTLALGCVVALIGLGAVLRRRLAQARVVRGGKDTTG